MWPSEFGPSLGHRAFYLAIGLFLPQILAYQNRRHTFDDGANHPRGIFDLERDENAERLNDDEM